jgi:hypothetical protein
MRNVTIPRSLAEAILEAVRVALAEGGTDRETVYRIEQTLKTAGVPLLRLCEGEVHETGGDGCSLCAPRWGVAGPTVKVRR